MKDKHYPALDGLRGVAILLVLLHHFSQMFADGGATQKWLIEVTRSFWIGVDLFFVLSGFLITGILLDTKNAERKFTTFYARRVLRIFPLYYAYIFLVFVALPALGVNLVDVSQENPAFYWAYAANFRVAWHGWPSLGLAHLWSLSIEEQFYLVWPLVIYMTPRKWLRYVLPACVLLPFTLRLLGPLSGGTYLPVYAFTLTRADGLFIGAFLALFIREESWQPYLLRIQRQRYLVPVTVLFVAMGTMGLGFSFYPDYWGPVERLVVILITCLLFGSVLARSLAVGRLNAALQSATLRWFGKYSYGIYVLHVPLVLVVTMLLPASTLGMYIPFAALRVVIYLTSFCVLTWTATMMSWKLLEQPMLRLKRYFTYHHDSPVAESAELVQQPA